MAEVKVKSERELAAGLLEAQRRRQTACWLEVEQVCEKHRCRLVAQVTIRGSVVSSQIVVVDKGE